MELEVLRPHKPASSPAGFFTLSSAFSSFLISFSRIRQPKGTSSMDVSKRDLTDVSQAVDPFAARKVDIGLVRVSAVFLESLTASAIAFAIKLLPGGGSCGSVRPGMKRGNILSLQVCECRDIDQKLVDSQAVNVHTGIPSSLPIFLGYFLVSRPSVLRKLLQM